MLLARRNQDIMPSLINELMGWNNWNNSVCTGDDCFSTPKMNITESDKDFEIEISAPGAKKEDMNLSIDSENNLVITLDTKEEKEESDAKDDTKKEDRHYIRREFSRMQFKQMLALPENVKKEQINAKMEDGILRITLPKVSEEEKKALTQTIEIC